MLSTKKRAATCLIGTIASARFTLYSVVRCRKRPLSPDLPLPRRVDACAEGADELRRLGRELFSIGSARLQRGDERAADDHAVGDLRCGLRPMGRAYAEAEGERELRGSADSLHVLFEVRVSFLIGARHPEERDAVEEADAFSAMAFNRSGVLLGVTMRMKSTPRERSSPASSSL